MQAMSKIIIVQEGQTIMDIAVQHCGNIDVMMDIVEANNMRSLVDVTGAEYNLADAILPGLKLTIEDEWIVNKIVKDITQNIATAK
jgi:hypothetical protein